MIPLLPLLVLRSQDPSAPKLPAWVAAVLRDAPPSPPEPPAPRDEVQPNGVRAMIPGVSYLDYNTLPETPPGFVSETTRMDLHTADLLDRGEYERAYAVQDVGHPDHEMDGDTLFADAALLTGRYADAQGLLARWLRRRTADGSMPGDNGGTETLLSAAVSLRGQAYPGQGASVLARLRQDVARQLSNELPLLPEGAPADPAGVALLSLVALGVEENRPACLEWALRLDPGCGLAGLGLWTMYEGRPGHAADLARVAALMRRNLPPDLARLYFPVEAKKPKARPAATKPKAKSP